MFGRSSCEAGEFEVLVDRMVKMDCGMDFGIFQYFLEYSAKREMPFCGAKDRFPGIHLIRLKQISAVVRNMIQFQGKCTPSMTVCEATVPVIQRHVQAESEVIC